MIKRTFDILVSILVLAMLLVPMLVIAILIRLGSPGKAIFAQRRAGRNGKPFTILKFRTMRDDADPYGSSPHSGEDPRLTRLGKFLREKSLDELPQVFNVIMGQMSLVGPRPLYERQAELWDETQRRRLEVLPGITGYAQAYGRGQLTIEEKIEMDVHYVDNQSFWFDLRIIMRTAINILRPRGEVYEKQYSSDKEYENDQ
ncbi:MAG: sugar transferase [Phycisphaerales bacterium]|nr:sugar transferase [Phycisphaerales bacterium]